MSHDISYDIIITYRKNIVNIWLSIDFSEQFYGNKKVGEASFLDPTFLVMNDYFEEDRHKWRFQEPVEENVA